MNVHFILFSHKNEIIVPFLFQFVYGIVCKLRERVVVIVSWTSFHSGSLYLFINQKQTETSS